MFLIKKFRIDLIISSLYWNFVKFSWGFYCILSNVFTYETFCYPIVNSFQVIDNEITAIIIIIIRLNESNSEAGENIHCS